MFFKFVFLRSTQLCFPKSRGVMIIIYYYDSEGQRSISFGISLDIDQLTMKVNDNIKINNTGIPKCVIEDLLIRVDNSPPRDLRQAGNKTTVVDSRLGIVN